MTNERTSALELKIAELEAQIRGVDVSALDFGTLAAFSAGNCTNNCTAACTIGCTNGCTGTCAVQRIEDVVTQPAAKIQENRSALAGVQLFQQLTLK